MEEQEEVETSSQPWSGWSQPWRLGVESGRIEIDSIRVVGTNVHVGSGTESQLRRRVYEATRRYGYGCGYAGDLSAQSDATTRRMEVDCTTGSRLEWKWFG